MKVFVVFFALLVLAFAAHDLTPLFKDFQVKYGRKYGSEEEEQKRFSIFKQNFWLSSQLNSLEPDASYGITKFSDLTPEEFKSMYLNKRPTDPEATRDIPVIPEYNDVSIEDVPDTFNWADKPGTLTPVKNQEQCGSCWAFSTVETIESQNALAGKGLKVLSPQQIVDCDTVDQGCNGGDTPTAYKYVQDAGGLELDSDYQYTGRDGKCAFDKSKVAASISGFKYVTQTKNETQMLVSLPIDGPPSICVDAASWQFYMGGIVRYICGQSLDHCVQLTGYASDGSTPYWIIRNSWGDDWGHAGFIWVERGKNLCGVSNEVTLAVV